MCVIELGGTLGDIESMPFVEALRQLQGRWVGGWVGGLGGRGEAPPNVCAWLS